MSIQWDVSKKFQSGSKDLLRALDFKGAILIFLDLIVK